MKAVVHTFYILFLSFALPIFSQPITSLPEEKVLYGSYQVIAIPSEKDQMYELISENPKLPLSTYFPDELQLSKDSFQVGKKNKPCQLPRYTIIPTPDGPLQVIESKGNLKKILPMDEKNYLIEIHCGNNGELNSYAMGAVFFTSGHLLLLGHAFLGPVYLRK